MGKTPSRRKQYRSVVFTLHNPTEEETEKFTNFLNVLPTEIRYITFQTEYTHSEDPTNEAIHFQGYCEFEKRHRMGGVKRILSQRISIREREWTQEQAIGYCQKERSRAPGPRGENGMKSYTRVDSMKNVAKDIRLGVDLEELKDRYPVQNILYGERINEAFIRERGPRNLTPSKDNVHIYVGPSGSGKSTTAKMLYPEAYHGVWPTGGRWWWPFYEGQKVVIFDEFREELKYRQMLKLLDIHPMKIEYKGGNSHLVAEKIIITTIRDPKTWYNHIRDKVELARRINENCTIFDFTPGKKYPHFEYKPRKGTFTFDEYDPMRDDEDGYNNEGRCFYRRY